MTSSFDDQIDPEQFEDDTDEPIETLPCPSCGAEVYEETECCPHCGDWIMPLAASSRRRSVIWFVAAALALIAIAYWVVR